MRTRRKSFKRNLAEFAEKVAYRIGKLDNIKKLEPRWSQGIFLGVSWRRGEALIGTKSGVVCSSAIRRINSERGWPMAMFWEFVEYLGIVNASLRSILSGKGYYYHRGSMQTSPEYHAKKDHKYNECDDAARTMRATATFQDVRDVGQCLRGGGETYSEPSRRPMEDIFNNSESGQKRKRAAGEN